MAQKTEKEETEFQVKEALTSRVTATAATVTASCKAEATERSTPATVSLKDPPPISRKRPDREEPEVSETKREVKRCSGCKRRVGLTGFPCRCGELFCSEHRYSDRHDCSFDYKTAGREAIARENPVVKAAKIVRV